MEITAQMVKESYDKNPYLKPVQRSWGYPNTNCACGLTAVFVAQHSWEYWMESYSNVIGSWYDFLREDLDITDNFASGFVQGFDGGKYYSESTNEEGYAIGVEARKLVFGDDAPPEQASNLPTP